VCSPLLPSLRCACIGRVFAVWLNDLNPVALRLTDWLQVRWYGLAYVLGFVAAFLVMRWVVRRGRGVLAEKDLADFVTYTALFGVMLGGRLGYMLLYDRAEFFAHPLTFFKLTSGGMASHGGILGIFIFTWVYAKRKKVSWPGLGDMLVVPAPLGIFAGRVANFINGELWGHEARGVAWAVRFPLETFHTDAAGEFVHPGLNREVTERVKAALGPEAASGDHLPQSMLTLLRQGNTIMREAMEMALPPRHPSQLYEALLEGLLLFAILFWVRWRWQLLPHGLLTGLFFILYALFRIGGEFWRVPDAAGLAWLHPLTPGQQYSLPMLVIGAGFLWYAWRQKPGPPENQKIVAAP
jgi:phosphatidylglycerol---prolipoprotein diacylglyceryl transferase